MEQPAKPSVTPLKKKWVRVEKEKDEPTNKSTTSLWNTLTGLFYPAQTPVTTEVKNNPSQEQQNIPEAKNNELRKAQNPSTKIPKVPDDSITKGQEKRPKKATLAVARQGKSSIQKPDTTPTPQTTLSSTRRKGR